MSRFTTRQQIVRHTLFVAVLGTALTGAVRGIASTTPAHASRAEDLVTAIKAADNDYNTSSTVVWPATGVTPSNNTVCGQFVTRLIQKSYGHTDSDFYRCIGSNSPFAKTYHDWFLSGQTCNSKLAHKHVRTVTLGRVGDWKAGDFIAIKNLTVETNNTGHMAMVAAAPELLSEENGIRQYAVTVIDSSSDAHDAQDTRVTRPDATKPDRGVGKGKMLIYADASDDQVVGHCWSTDNGSTMYDQTQKSLVVGRLVTP